MRSYWDLLPIDFKDDILRRKAKLDYNAVVKEIKGSVLKTVEIFLLKKYYRYSMLLELHSKPYDFEKFYERYSYFRDYQEECVKFMGHLNYIYHNDMFPANKDELRVFCS